MEMLKKTKMEAEPSTLRYSDSLDLRCLLGGSRGFPNPPGDSHVQLGCRTKSPGVNLQFPRDILRPSPAQDQTCLISLPPHTGLGTAKPFICCRAAGETGDRAAQSCITHAAEYSWSANGLSCSGGEQQASVRLLSSASPGNLLAVRGQRVLQMQGTRLAGLPLQSHFAEHFLFSLCLNLACPESVIKMKTLF